MSDDTYEGGLRKFVNDRIRKLHMAETHGESSARATIAALRRAPGTDPGNNPALWDVTFGLPDKYVRRNGAAVSLAESAVFTALTLWATHRGSKNELSNTPGNRFGVQMLALANRKDRKAAVSRRLYALASSDSPAGIVAHSRGLITQLAAENLNLDFGAFAVDILNLQRPEFATKTRAQWGRDFTKSSASTSNEQDNS